ncbi:MAG: HD domain-containing protein [Spirochaetales bacterium]|nr:HD domain-containing protein [Spirochaetales bacterium]
MYTYSKEYILATQVEKLKQLVQLDKDLQGIQDLDILLEKILYNARKFTDADAGTIYLREGKMLSFRFAQNDTKQKELGPRKKLLYSVFKVEINRNSISGYVADTKKILNIPNVYKIDPDMPYSFNSSYDKQTKYKTRSMLTIPLLDNQEEVLGVLQIINSKSPKGNLVGFNKEKELYVEHFANSASVALERAKLTRQIILRMISMAELRDPKETGPHVNRVASYSVELYEAWAARHNLAEHTIERNRDLLRMAAMLHDVGKVGISDLILKKPGGFSDDEYKIMKSHTFIGARLFNDKQSEFDEMASIVALTHHENWDGTGYPGHIDITNGESLNTPPTALAGEEIPIFGRIVSVADVYDALCSRRVYKKAWTEEKVLEEMEAMSGTKFDPELVEIFFERLNSIKNIQNKYPEQED